MARPKHAAGRSAALRTALGIGRLDALLTVRSPVSESLAAYGKLDQAARRQLIKAVLMVAAALLGFWGFQVTVDEATRWKMSTVWSNVFKTLQLLTTQFPPNLPSDEVPLQLQVARFALPIFAVWFAATAIFRRFNRPVMAWWAGLTSGHVVLFGDTPVARALARSFRAAGREVVAITRPADADKVMPIEASGARVVFGDATQPQALRRAGIHRAAAAIAADDVGKSAVALATSVAAINRGKRPASAPPLTFLIRLGHRELRALIATQVAAALRESRVDLRLYLRERTVARSLLSRYPADWGRPPGPYDVHAAIVGLGDMGAELLLQLARVAVPSPGRRAVFTVIDTRAAGIRDQLLGESPGLANCGELRFITSEIQPSAIRANDVEEWFHTPLPATAIYVCCGDDHANLSMAIGLRRAYARLGVPAPPIFVYQREGRDLVEALPHIHATAMDTLRIIAFGGVEEEADPFFLIDEEIDDLARLMHEEYLRSRGKIADAEGMTPAAVPWPDLPDTYRTANRSQADHVSAKLRTLGWHAVAVPTAKAPPLDPRRLEEIAEQEHERWCRDRWLGGWTHGERDDDKRHHPNLLPYERLSEEIRELDRKTVASLPGLLTGLGIGLRQDRRLGIWFGREPVPAMLLAEVAGHAAPPGREDHVQLVLPMQNAAELALAQSLARHGATGVDVALLREPSVPAAAIAGDIDRLGLRRLIDASDRTFVLDLGGGEDDEVAILAALCAVSDRVVIARGTAAAGKALAEQLDADCRRKIDIVAMAT